MAGKAKSRAVRDRVRELRRVRAGDLVAHPMNWRQHPKAQRDALRGLLDDIGFAGALLVRETDDGQLQIIDGHLRAETTPDMEVPVLVLDVDEAEALKLLATIDPLAAMATPDPDMLRDLLGGVAFDAQAINDLLAGLTNGAATPSAPKEDPGAQMDRADELREKWGTERGQVWEIGRHRLMCGDATDATAVARVLNGSSIGMIVADPPYGMRLDTDFSKMRQPLGLFGSKKLTHGRNYTAVAGDDADFDAAPVLAAWGSPPEQFWFGADYYASTLPDAAHSGAWLVWDKRLDEAADRMFGSCFELIWSHRRCRRVILRCKWAGLFGLEKEPSTSARFRGRQHPTQKPVALLASILGMGEGLVADPFLGSGTTMVAAEQLDRTSYGMEIEPKYVAVALERMAGMGLEGKLT